MEEKGNAEEKVLDTKKGQSVLKGVEIGIVALSLAVSTAALIVVLTMGKGSSSVTHLVTFRNYDNAFITSETINDGEVATDPGITPTKPSDSANTYAFSGWDNGFTITITEDMTYTAEYSATPIPTTSPTVNYLVQFLDSDGTTILYSENVPSGGKASYGSVIPTKASLEAGTTYEFSKWDKDISTTVITAATNFTAIYDTYYEATFVNDDGTIAGVKAIKKGEHPSLSTYSPSKAKSGYTVYTFDGWKESASGTDASQYVMNSKATFIATFVSAVEGSTGLVFTPDNETTPTYYSITGYTGSDADVYIPATYGADIPVTHIAESAFASNTTVTSVRGDSITSIGSKAFSSCNQLISSNFASATEVLSSAFANCSKLDEVTLLVATSIGSEAFSSDSALETISFPKVDTVESKAFLNCSSITTISLPKLSTVDSTAFNGCSSVTTAVVDDPSTCKLLSAQSSHLVSCSCVGEAVACSIPEKTFFEETNLSYLFLHPMEDVGAYAFYNTSIAETPSVGDDCIIHEKAFAKCVHLSKINLITPLITATSVDVYDYAFAGDGYIESLQIPEIISFKGIDPFQGDTFNSSSISFEGSKSDFGTIVTNYTTAYPSSKLFPSGTAVNCRGSVYTMA